MRYLLLCCLFGCIASATISAQTPTRSDAMQIARIDTNAFIFPDFELSTSGMPYEEYHLEAWVATIKTHYADVQAMAQRGEPMLPPTDRPNSEALLVTKTF